MTIVTHIRPFIFAQPIMVMDDNEEIKEVISSSLKNLPENICELSRKYNCTKVNIAGSKKYNKGLEEKIKKCYMAKFNCNDLEIELI